MLERQVQLTLHLDEVKSKEQPTIQPSPIGRFTQFLCVSLPECTCGCVAIVTLVLRFSAPQNVNWSNFVYTYLLPARPVRSLPNFVLVMIRYITEPRMLECTEHHSESIRHKCQDLSLLPGCAPACTLAALVGRLLRPCCSRR